MTPLPFSLLLGQHGRGRGTPGGGGTGRPAPDSHLTEQRPAPHTGVNAIVIGASTPQTALEGVVDALRRAWRRQEQQLGASDPSVVRLRAAHDALYQLTDPRNGVLARVNQIGRTNATREIATRLEIEQLRRARPRSTLQQNAVNQLLADFSQPGQTRVHALFPQLTPSQWREVVQYTRRVLAFQDKMIAITGQSRAPSLMAASPPADAPGERRPRTMPSIDEADILSRMPSLHGGNPPSPDVDNWQSVMDYAQRVLAWDSFRRMAAPIREAEAVMNDPSVGELDSNLRIGLRDQMDRLRATALGTAGHAWTINQISRATGVEPETVEGLVNGAHAVYARLAVLSPENIVANSWPSTLAFLAYPHTSEFTVLRVAKELALNPEILDLIDSLNGVSAATIGAMFEERPDQTLLPSGASRLQRLRPSLPSRETVLSPLRILLRKNELMSLITLYRAAQLDAIKKERGLPLLTIDKSALTNKSQERLAGIASELQQAQATLDAAIAGNPNVNLYTPLEYEHGRRETLIEYAERIIGAPRRGMVHDGTDAQLEDVRTALIRGDQIAFGGSLDRIAYRDMAVWGALVTATTKTAFATEHPMLQKFLAPLYNWAGKSVIRMVEEVGALARLQPRGFRALAARVLIGYGSWLQALIAISNMISRLVNWMRGDKAEPTYDYAYSKIYEIVRGWSADEQTTAAIAHAIMRGIIGSQLSAGLARSIDPWPSFNPNLSPIDMASQGSGMSWLSAGPGLTRALVGAGRGAIRSGPKEAAKEIIRGFGMLRSGSRALEYFSPRYAGWLREGRYVAPDLDPRDADLHERIMAYIGTGTVSEDFVGKPTPEGYRRLLAIVRVRMGSVPQEDTDRIRQLRELESALVELIQTGKTSHPEFILPSNRSRERGAYSRLPALNPAPSFSHALFGQTSLEELLENMARRIADQNWGILTSMSQAGRAFARKQFRAAMDQARASGDQSPVPEPYNPDRPSGRQSLFDQFIRDYTEYTNEAPGARTRFSDLHPNEQTMFWRFVGSYQQEFGRMRGAGSPAHNN